MRLKKKYICNKKERTILSDILPYELPVTFSNRYFYRFLIDNKIEFNGKTIKWNKKDLILFEIIKLLFGIDKKSRNISEIKKELITIPFNYKILHKEKDFRDLTIIHPINQLTLIDFYDKCKELILYYCNISPFSIRRPHKVAKLTFYKDKTHLESLAYDQEHNIVEEFEKEYENLKTFFVYKKYSNIYKFYESYQYHRCEKKYKNLYKFDIANCFDSIYTHSITWALLNREIVKDNLSKSRRTFGDKFDTLMQKLNYNETNGIVIGPEFSRIFAEIILQKIDKNVSYRLEEQNIIYKVNYEIFRYVDDYFIFYDEERVIEDILKEYRLQLREYKLCISDLKIESFEKPIITGLTRAKQHISDLFNQNLLFKKLEQEKLEGDDNTKSEDRYSMYVSSNKLITRFKIIIKEKNISYKDILNYTLACIDRKVLKLIKTCDKIEDKKKHESKIIKAILEILDFTLFLYSVAPRVNTTIKLCLILSKIIKFAKNKEYFNYDNKHLIFKKIYDDVSFILNKNKSHEHIQVETLYLLVMLKELGKEYKLDQQVLCDYFNVDFDEEECRSNLNYLSITVLLFYIENKVRYNDLKIILKKYITKKFKEVRKDKRGKITELTLLLFDLIVCPYLEIEYRKGLLDLYGIDKETTKIGIINRKKYWFTKWSNFNFGKELEAKRSEEVY
jgi:hypothetical protein